MTTLLIEYQVEDFAAWKRMFDRDPMDRKGHGVTGHSIRQSVDDPRQFLLSLEFPSEQEAMAFLQQLQPVFEVSGARRSWILREMIS